MAQKSIKTLAARNIQTLNRTHLISLGVYSLFLLLRLVFNLQRRWLPFILLNVPVLAVEIWFERIGRPVYVQNGSGTELKRAGEDLEAKGLTEWMWDVVYWTWACTGLAAVAGDWAWWLYLAVPFYSAYLAYNVYSGARQGMSGLGGSAEGIVKESSGQSKRQAKMEKRGGQRVQYRQ